MCESSGKRHCIFNVVLTFKLFLYFTRCFNAIKGFNIIDIELTTGLNKLN